MEIEFPQVCFCEISALEPEKLIQVDTDSALKMIFNNASGDSSCPAWLRQSWLFTPA